MAFLGDLDRSTLQWINGFIGLHPGFDDGLRFLADWNFGRSAWLGCFLIWAWFRFRHSDTRLKVIAGTVGLIIATLMSRALQVLVPVHERPFNFIAELGLKEPRHLDTHWGAVSSFPSDTATLYFALAAIIFSISRGGGIAAIAWVFVFIAMPRVYILYHWPSDVLGGMALGIGCVWGALSLRDRVPQFSKVMMFEKLEPGAFYPLVFMLLYQIVDSFSAVEMTIHKIAMLGTWFSHASHG